jgi:RNA polymerase sigma factor (sigma-70 family)
MCRRCDDADRAAHLRPLRRHEGVSLAGTEVQDVKPEPAERHLLINVAYRMVGTVTEAEDAVQEAYARWYAMPPSARAEVVSRTGWLVRVVSRICLDTLRSARVRRERYVGEWLPEPVPGSAIWTSVGNPDREADPAERVGLDESLATAVLVMLDTMTPAERVAFVLHDVFRYSFSEIGAVLRRSPAACRQLASSARRRLPATVRSGPRGTDRARSVAEFRSAWEAADLNRLVKLLGPDSVVIADGGGLVSAGIEPITGATLVARSFVAVLERQPGLTVHGAIVNGQEGLVARADGRPLAVISFEVGVAIERLWVMRNPDKLTGWA